MSSPAPTNSSRHLRIKEIFAAVADAPASERDALLSSLCDGDATLRDDVLSLLEHLEAPRLDMTAAVNHVRGAVEAALTDIDSGTAAAPEQVDNFRVTRLLGEGGMGVVYLAEQESPRRLVALKLMRPGVAGQQLLRRFRREAEVLGSLRHPNIAQIYAAGTAEMDGPLGRASTPYFAMEYVQGLNVLDHCESRGLGVRERVALLACVCDAVEHAHGRGVIHRDLKPANILVESSGPAEDPPSVGTSYSGTTHAATPHARWLGEPKILDFGIARRDGSTAPADSMATFRTAVGQVVGTLPYMSPEQVAGDGDAVDRRSDVYALGVILYQLLARRLPLEPGQRTLAEAARMIAETEPAGLGSVDRSLRGDLDTIAAKCLEKDPRRRYQSAAELAADLRRYLEDRPIEARPASAVYQLRKFARRNRGLVAGAALAVVALVAGTVVSVVLALRAIESRDAAEAQLRETMLQSDRSTQSYLILKEIVDQIDPAASGGRLPTIREVLDRARGRLETMSGEEPEVLGMLLAELARGYLRIGEEEVADALLAASVRNFRASDHEDLRQPLAYVEALSAAGGVADRRGRPEEARTLRGEACTLLEMALRQSAGMAPRSLAGIHLRLGELRQARGELEEAGLHLADGVAILRSLDPDGDDITAGYELVLASLLMSQGRPLEAEAALRQAAATLERQHGPAHGETLKARGNLISAINQAGRFEEGVALATAVLADRQRAGADPLATMAVRLNLAFGLLGCGRPAEALPQALDVLEWREANLGPAHPDTARARAIVGTACRMLGRLDESEALLEQALRDHRAALGEHHVRVAEDWLELSALRLAQGLPAEARAAAEATSVAIHAFGGEDHPLLARALREEARLALGELEEALAVATIARDRIASRTAPGHPQVADALLALAEIELVRGDNRAARDLTLEAERELGLNPVEEVLLAPAKALRGAAMIRLGDVQAGRALAEEAIRQLARSLGPEAPAVRDAERWLQHVEGR